MPFGLAAARCLLQRLYWIIAEVCPHAQHAGRGTVDARVPGVLGCWGAPPEGGLAPGLVDPGYEEKPAWFKESFLDIREDLAEAAAANRRVILYLYQDGCPYCAKLLREGFADQEIGALARGAFDVIALNLWGDREVTGLAGEQTSEKAFAAGLKVQFTPTLLMLNEEGQTVLRIDGYFPPHRPRTALDYVAQRRDRLGERFQDFYLVADPKAASDKFHTEGGFLSPPLRLARTKAGVRRPLVVMFEQPTCAACDELHQDILRREPLAWSLTAFDAAVVNAWSKETVETRDGRDLPLKAWSSELGIQYTPSLVFFDPEGREVFRAAGYLKAFHIHGALDYVATGAYRWQPNFQRYLEARRSALEARGFKVDLMD
jgi:thioredoxin-related protein